MFMKKGRVLPKAVSIMMSATMLSTVAASTSNPVFADDTDNNSVIKIMPLGDSITFGMADDGGYRKYLDYFLNEKGITNFDFVGPEGSDNSTFTYNGKTVSFDDNHAGYSGYTITDLPGGWFGNLNGILETMQKGDYIKKYSPDAIILQIGTNDISNGHLDGSEERLHLLLDYLLDNMNGTIFITTIPDLGGTMFGDDVNNNIASYNKLVKKVADEYVNNGEKVVFADIHSVINASTDLADGVHPNSSGYEKMGKYWADVIEDNYSSLSTSKEKVEVLLPSDSTSSYINDSFEADESGWTGRGGATVEKSLLAAYSGRSSLYCSGRTASWNGASKELDSTTFKAGESYSFSVNAMYETGAKTEEFKLTLQYTDSAGTTAYDEIAAAKVSAGQWVQLANTSYTIPVGASDLIMYVETIDSEISFYIDEAVIAPADTKIEGAKPIVVSPGDVDCSGRIDVFDMILMRKAVTTGIENKYYQQAADVDKNGTIEIADAVQLEQFLLGKISEFTFVEPPKPDNKWDDYSETASQQWIDFYENSIYSMGNTYRLTKKLEAAENGEKLTIAYLGGSITEGKKYTTPFSNYVKSTFAAGGFTEVNAGLSGTSSVVGLVRSESNIVEKNPDIVFLEFSVNDHEDIMYKKCFESAIKKFLDLPNEPAVVILINRAKGGFSSQKQMIPVGENFDIPIISMDNALTKAFNSGLLSTGDYFSDEYHPHDKGGQLIADCLGYFFRKAMKTENRSDSYTVPSTTVYGTEYQNCKNVDPKTLTGFNAGSWTAGSGYGGNLLPYSYTLNGSSPMKFKANGKGFIVVFKANSSGMGSIDVTVNGKTTKISGNKQYCWGGPDAELGYYQDASGELDVSISGSGSFTIWGIGLIE